MNLHVFLAQDVGLERLLAVGAHEVLVLGVAGHVPSHRTGLKKKFSTFDILEMAAMPFLCRGLWVSPNKCNKWTV